MKPSLAAIYAVLFLYKYIIILLYTSENSSTRTLLWHWHAYASRVRYRDARSVSPGCARILFGGSSLVVKLLLYPKDLFPNKTTKTKVSHARSRTPFTHPHPNPTPTHTRFLNMDDSARLTLVLHPVRPLRVERPPHPHICMIYLYKYMS